MPCCGQKRENIGRSYAPGIGTPPNGSGVYGGRKIFFEYTGRTSMVVIGTGSGSVYRFTAPGSKLTVDVRDVPYLRTVPNLEEIQTP